LGHQMSFSEINSEIYKARQVLNEADNAANQMAALLKGRLRKVSSWELAALKKELKDFNAHTKTWKE